MVPAAHRGAYCWAHQGAYCYSVQFGPKERQSEVPPKHEQFFIWFSLILEGYGMGNALLSRTRDLYLVQY